ncbi:TetR/AcrR family transcriptional regulator [Erythrobacter ani]|uniref:TetR family transcriptional regulator n=1 Tax=Erythrobacter ani TaxID=2827235 RepID=A0ABS6SMB3_9SPHN|nr:TetR/AcrR family transcriptional regulator [Erythrobacter ani]MBV7266127.1 TetR family transcriptional regulator [Erythrobacter ani]
MVATQSKSNKRQQQREKSRASVLNAAAQLFADLGYDGASLGAVATEAGISKQNLLYYFPDKEQLWKDTIVHVFDQVNVELARELEDFDETEAPLRHIIRAYFAVCRRHRAYVVIPMIEGTKDTWRSRFITDRYLKDHIVAFEFYIDRMRKAGQLPQVDAVYLQNLIAGGAQLFLALSPLWNRALGVDTQSEEFFEGYENAISTMLGL